MLTDVRGYPIDTENAAAAAAFDQAIARFFEFRLDAPALADLAIEADPNCALAQMTKAFMLLGAQSRRLLPVVAEHVAAAERSGAGRHPRARGWLAGLKALNANDLPRAAAAFRAHLTDWPRDLFIMKQMQQQTLFWRGLSLELRDSMLRVRHAWDESVPGYAHYLGLLAFGYEEAGDYVAAERAGRACVERAPDDIWGIHSVAHVLEMQGRHREGIAWMDYPAEAWADRAPLARHLWWHKSLFHWDSGDYEGALALLDRSIYPEPTALYIDIQNAAALLWRLEFAGVDVGDRWRVLAEQAETVLDDQMLGFTDSHIAVTLARAGRGEALARHRQVLAERADSGGWAAALTAEATLPVADAIHAYCNGDYDRAVEGLLAVREEWSRLGGSHAQRDLYAQALIDSAVKAGRTTLAEALLAERSALHPTSRGVAYWRAQLAA